MGGFASNPKGRHAARLEPRRLIEYMPRLADQS
jgi:hypothetical protein